MCQAWFQAVSRQVSQLPSQAEAVTLTCPGSHGYPTGGSLRPEPHPSDPEPLLCCPSTSLCLEPPRGLLCPLHRHTCHQVPT